MNKFDVMDVNEKQGDRIAELEQQLAELKAENKEIEHALDCMVTATWELQESYNALMEAAFRVLLKHRIRREGPSLVFYEYPSEEMEALAALQEAE